MAENMSAKYQKPYQRHLEALKQEKDVAFSSDQDIVVIKKEPQSDSIFDTLSDFKVTYGEHIASTSGLISKAAVYESSQTKSDNKNTEIMSTDQVCFDDDIKLDIKLEVCQTESACEPFTYKEETSVSCCDEIKEENSDDYQTNFQPKFKGEAREQKYLPFKSKEEAEYNICESSMNIDDVKPDIKPVLKQEVVYESDEDYHKKVSKSLQGSLKDQHIKFEKKECNSQSNNDCNCNNSIEDVLANSEEINNINYSVDMKKEEQEEELMSSNSGGITNREDNCYQSHNEANSPMSYSSDQGTSHGKLNTNGDTFQYRSTTNCNMKGKEHLLIKYECTVCSKWFSSKASLTRHTKIHTGFGLYTCTQCSKGFACKSELKAHEIIHTGGLKPYQCTQCSKGFTRYSHLRQHETIHTGLKPYQCTQCSKRFPSKAQLTVHEIIHTGLKPFQCTQCTKVFTRKCHLMRHERMHSGLQPYQCTQCLKRFTDKSNLKQHEKSHNSLRPYQCTQCPKQFVSKGQLTEHERVHMSSKPYQCTQCIKSFTRNFYLIQHERIHTGLKPYQCTQCLKSFAIKSNLKKHEKIHSGLIPYQCTQCPKSFRQKSSFTRHERSHSVLCNTSTQVTVHKI